MTTQREITARTPLLDDKGHLVMPGWARGMVFDYDPGKVRARPFALKEWDFYQVMLGEWVLQMTIGHVSYAANFASTLLNPGTGEKHTFYKLQPLPGRGQKLPLDPDGAFAKDYHGRGWRMGYDIGGGKRRLWLQAEGIDVDVTLLETPGDERMVIATPFDKPNQFYLNCKENYYGVQGHASFGDVTAVPAPGDTALLDWGRGVWPFHQEWFWGNGSANLPEGRFGMNIGWGFGDLSNASENMIFWNGKAVKLGALDVTLDQSDYMKPWRFVDEGGRFDFTMTPVHDHETATKLLFVDNHCHQVFGNFTGRAVLPDGQVIEVKDMPAFCEHAVNNW